MKALRSSAIAALINSGLNKSSAENYEKAIYSHCERTMGKTASKTAYSQIYYDKLGELIGAAGRKERELILANLKEDVQGWDSCVYESQRQEYITSMDRSVLKPKAIKGLYICKNEKCKSDEFYVWSQQTRSSDEGMTTMRQCAKCGKRGKE